MTTSLPAQNFYEEEKAIDFKFYLFLFKKYFYIVFTFFVIVVTLASIYVSRVPDKYEAVAQLIIEKPQFSWSSSDAESVTPGLEGWSEDYYNTQIEIMLSPGVLREVITQLKLAEYYNVPDPDVLIEKITRMITVSRVRRSRLFNVVVLTEDPRLSARLANAVARAYIRKNFEDMLYYSREILAWLPKTGDPDETISIEDPLGGVRQITREDLIESLPSIRSDPMLNSLKEKLSAQKSELELLTRQYREKHPLVIKALSEVKHLESSIEAEKKRIVQSLKSQAEGKHQVSPARLFEEAVQPTAPVPSKRIQIVAGAGIAELILSFLILFLLNYFDDSLRSAEDFERRGVVLPFLGPVPLIKNMSRRKDGKRLVFAKEGQFDVTESFRYLRVAINFSAPPDTLKTLVISSCTPSEGKSFVSTNIATSLARDGIRTLIVDGDLRRPVIHTAFHMDNETGLSNYLTSNVDFDAIIKETSIENLWVVTSGPQSPSPGEILGSDRMKDFLKIANQRFDRVVIDCPPLTGLGDGYVIGSLIGHLIMVVASGRTPSELIKRTHRQLDKAGVKIVGVILNQVDIEKEKHGGYYKYYYNTYNKYYHSEPKENDQLI